MTNNELIQAQNYLDRTIAKATEEFTPIEFLARCQRLVEKWSDNISCRLREDNKFVEIYFARPGTDATKICEITTEYDQQGFNMSDDAIILRIAEELEDKLWQLPRP